MMLAPQVRKDLSIQVANERKLIEGLLPAHMKFERFATTIFLSVTKNPDLLTVDRPSLIAAFIQAASWGLEPDTPANYCNIVKIGGKAALWPQYKGLLELAYRTGELLHTEARLVFPGDKFEYAFGLESVLRHEPIDGQRDGNNYTHCYAIVHKVDSVKQWDVMTRDEIIRIAKKSPAFSNANGPWKNHEQEMAKKTVYKRLLKTVRFSPEKAVILQQALEQDNHLDAGKNVVIDMPNGDIVTVEQEQDKSDKLAAQLNQEAQSITGVQPEQQGEYKDELPL